MKTLSKIVFLVIIAAIVFSAYKITQEAENQKNYEKCVSVCSFIVEDHFNSLKSCMGQYKEKFLGEENP